MFTPIIQRMRLFYQEHRAVSPDLFDAAITLCDESLIEPTFQKIHDLYNFARFVFGVVQTPYYYVHEQIVNLTTILILESIETQQLTRDQVIELITNAMNLNAMMAQLFAQLGLHGQSWNYQMRAFDPSWSNSRNEIDLGFATGMWVLAQKQGVFDIRLQIMESASNFFYISRHMGHNYSVCHDLFEFIRPWIKIGVADATEEDIFCVCFYAGILASNPQTEAVEQVRLSLTEQYCIERQRNPKLSLIIAETFATGFGAVSGEDVVKWARDALQTPSVQLHPQQRASLELNILLDECPLNALGIKNCIVNFLNELDYAIPDVLVNDLQRQRLSSLIVRVISASYRAGQYDFLVEMVYLWRTYRFGNEGCIPSSEALLVVIPNLRDKEVIYLIWNEGIIEHLALSASISLQEFLRRKGHFDGSWIVVLNQSESPLPQTPLDHPNYENSDQYLDALEAFFHTKKVAMKLQTISPLKSVRVLESTWVNVPLTSLIGLHADLPVSTLVTPQLSPESPLRRVVLWCDPDETLYHAHLEKDAVAHIFRKHGVKVDIIMGSECTPELFIEKYSDPEIDILWPMCHGSFDSDSPPDSTLGVAKHAGVRLGGLLPLTPERENRRLLILNACESGMAPQRSDAMAFIGFGPELTNVNQSVIGHLWAVDTFGATVFGILLAASLVRSPSWGEALNKARTDMAKGNLHIAEVLSADIDIDSDIIRMLSRPGNNPNKLGYWGSAVLFE